MIKSVLGHVRVRNSRIWFCATPDDPYASPMWASEMIDPHAHIELVVYNNELIGGRDSTQASRGGTQNAQMAFLSNRRPAKGSNTPNYCQPVMECAGDFRWPDFSSSRNVPAGSSHIRQSSFSGRRSTQVG